VQAELRAATTAARAERDAELAQVRKLLGDAARLQEQLSSATEDIFTLQKQLNGAIKRIDVLQDEKNAATEARNEAAARAEGLQVRSCWVGAGRSEVGAIVGCGM